MTLAMLDDLAPPLSRPLARRLPLWLRTATRAAYRITVAREAERVERAWRELEAACPATPYQRLAWGQAWLGARAAGDAEPALALAEDPQGRPLALLPLEVRNVGALRVAGFVGAKHANLHLALVRPEARAVLGDPAALLRAVAAEAGIDLFVLRNQPEIWEGTPNPLGAVPGRVASPSSGHRLALGPDREEVLKRIAGRDTRKKFRAKWRRLADLGEVAVRRAGTPAEVERVLAAFLAQKAERFDAQGLADPFARPSMVRFLRRATLDGLEGGRPAIELHALHAGDRVIATFGGSGDGRRFSGMFNSYALDPEIARQSPGELLLLDLIGSLAERGFTAFDLGVGEATYKDRFAPEPEPLFDTFYGVTARGRVCAPAFALSTVAKRRVKTDPRLRALAEGLARRFGHTRARAAAEGGASE